MLKPVCTSCKLFFRMKKGGYFFIEAMPSNGPAETDDELEKRASEIWRKENPIMSVFDCDEEMKKRYRARARAANSDHWQPYKLWSGDLWSCPGCGIEIISGVGLGPVAQRHHHDFAEKVERTGANRLQVNDC